MRPPWRTALVCLLLLPVVTAAEDSRLPIVTLRYEGGIGGEETTDEELETASYRHGVSVRIREDWTSDFTSTLLGFATRKEYLAQSGSYSSISLTPVVRWDIAKGLEWSLEFRYKWMGYDEPDSEGLSKNYTGLLALTSLALEPPTFGLLDRMTIAPTVRSAFDFYQEPAKSRQTHSIGLALESRIDGWTLGGRYRGVIRWPLGTGSTVESRFNHEFSVSATWDPNRE